MYIRFKVKKLLESWNKLILQRYDGRKDPVEYANIWRKMFEYVEGMTPEQATHFIRYGNNLCKTVRKRLELHKK